LPAARLSDHDRLDVQQPHGSVVAGMGADPSAGGTRFAFLGGLRLPGMRLLDPVLQPAAQRLALRPIMRLEHLVLAR
jgi:hypothetical protein